MSPPHVRHARHDYAKDDGGMWPLCGVWLGKSRMRSQSCPLLHCATAAKIAGFPALHKTRFSLREAVDNGSGRSLYKPPWRAAALAMARPAKPLTVYAVNHPARPWPCRMCGLRRLRCSPGRGRQAPGCLTSESEERETWTAESLRAASSNGEGFGFVRKRAAMEETSAV
jgi:hypothetical protein